MIKINNQINKLLPKAYIDIIENLLEKTEHWEIKVSESHIGIVIPAYGESKYIKKTLENLTIKQKRKPSTLIIIVYKLSSIKDTTETIINNFAKEHPEFKIVGINEELFPDKACIGHARAIGFSFILNLGLKRKLNLEQLYLMSSDADLLDIDKYYLDKVYKSFENPETSIVTCNNLFKKNIMKDLRLKTLKVIDDGFFKNQFKNMGVLNGRCYTIRGNKYVLSGGVDYTAQFDDIIFGINTQKNIGTSGYIWIDSYVVTSERRYKIAIEKSSLMDEYEKHQALGNKIEKIDSSTNYANIENFYKDHISEGLNVLAYYYSRRFDHTKDTYKELELEFNKYINYINSNLEHLKIINLDFKKSKELYTLYKSPNINSSWWKNKHIFNIEINLSKNFYIHFLYSLLEKHGYKKTIINSIIDLSPKGLKCNKIFLVNITNNSLLIKIYPLDEILMGEEELADSIYDLKLHEYLANKFDFFKPNRRLIEASYGKTKFFDRDYLISSIIEGQVLDKTSKEVITEGLITITNNMFKLYTQIGLSETPSLKQLLEQINLCPEEKLFLSNHFEKYIKDNESYTETAIKFFKADVIRSGTNTNKNKLINLIDHLTPFLEIKKYTLIHTDLKPKNIIHTKNSFVPIDWSRAQYGDPAVDIADIIISLMVYTDSTDIENFYKTYKDKISILSNYTEERIKFFMSFKLFSIARVFYPKYIKTAEEHILNNTSKPLKDFIHANLWVKGKYF